MASKSFAKSANGRKLPTIVLSARGQEKDKIQALDSGADDFRE